MNQEKSYLARDFKILLVLVILMGGVIATLWYLESTQNLFTNLASKVLTFN